MNVAGFHAALGTISLKKTAQVMLLVGLIMWCDQLVERSMYGRSTFYNAYDLIEVITNSNNAILD